MTEAWSQWEGHVINSQFHLKKYLAGSDRSAVFLTEDFGQEPQQVAIKLIQADSANAELQLSRWEPVQRLSHPHLIRLLHTGRCRLGTVELIFAVMEYAEENLAEILSQRPLTPQEARELLEPTLDAIAYLHGRGFVHGHLKPANVMASKDQLKLSSDGLCATGEAVSDPGKSTLYDPPEKASGEQSTAGDVWSLGMLMAEALTQSLPSSTEKEQADPVLPENLPAPFLDIVRGCLQRDPRRRWTIADIAARLHPTVPPPKPQERAAASSPAESAIRRFAFPVVATVVAVAGLLAGLGQLHHKPEARQDISAVRAEQMPETEGAASSSPETGDQQPGSDVSRRSAPVSDIQPPPASMQSQTQTQLNRGTEASGVVHPVLPQVPQTASDTIHGTVRVSVRVNVVPAGSVAEAELDSPGPSRYFARLALAAAQNWKFAPYDQDVDREFLLHFEFRNTGPRAFATRAAP